MPEPAQARFTDALGRQWTLSLDVNQLRLVRSELQVDLLTLYRDVPLLERLCEDAVLLVDILSVLLTQEIRQRSLDAQGFASGLTGETLDLAAQALVEAIANFSPPAKGRALLELWRRASRLTAKGLQQMETLLQTRGDALEQTLLDEMTAAFPRDIKSISGSLSGNGPESSESPTRDP